MEPENNDRLTFSLSQRDVCNELNGHYLREGIRMKKAAKGSFFKLEWMDDFGFLEQIKGKVMSMDIVNQLKGASIVQPASEEQLFKKYHDIYTTEYNPGKNAQSSAITLEFDPTLYNHIQLKTDSEVKMYFLRLAIEAIEKSMTFVCCKNPYWEIHTALEELMIVYHAVGDTENEIRVTQRAVELRPSDTNYTKRLNKLLGKDANLTIPPDPYKPIVVKKNLGEEYERLFRQMPEYDFSSEGISNHLSEGQIEDMIAPLRKIHNHFRRQLVNGENEERKFNYKNAANIYENSIAEGTFIPTTYNRLGAIYRKFKMYDDECRVTRCAIERFSALEAQRKEWVLCLAEKYGKGSIVSELLSQEPPASIIYYDNTVMYQSYKSNISKWEARLPKIPKQKKQ